MLKIRVTGFTLAELLVSLAILAEIATFTIPKVLSAQQNGQKNAIAKEAAAMISGAYQQAQSKGVVTTQTSMPGLTPYMNYVSVDTTSATDAFPNGIPSTFSCADYACIRLHNGAMLLADPTAFNTTNGIIYALIDPDGKATGQQDSLTFLLYYNGRLTTYGSFAGNSSYDPSWFRW